MFFLALGRGIDFALSVCLWLKVIIVPGLLCAGSAKMQDYLQLQEKQVRIGFLKQ